MNDYGLYMSENVSEWTSTPFEPTASMFISDMNFYTYDADDNAVMLKRKVIKGGSWKDVGAFELQLKIMSIKILQSVILVFVA